MTDLSPKIVVPSEDGPRIASKRDLVGNNLVKTGLTVNELELFNSSRSSPFVLFNCFRVPIPARLHKHLMTGVECCWHYAVATDHAHGTTVPTSLPLPPFESQH